MMQKRIYLIGILLLCLLANLMQISNAENTNKTSVQVKLMRSDFRVTGASCVVCLRKVGQKLKGSTGVIKADVSIYPPFGGLVIYDGNKTNIQTIFHSADSEHVSFADVETEGISQIPTLLLPKIMPSSSKSHSPTPVIR